jgi:hypothetical protein
MIALRKPDQRPVRKARPTGETFDPPAALEQAKALYPKVMAKLAE